MAVEGIDKLLGLTDSRYELSTIVAKRALQLKKGFPSLLSHEEYPKTRNMVTVALKEFVLDKGLKWGKNIPTVEQLQKQLELEEKLRQEYEGVNISSSQATL